MTIDGLQFHSAYLVEVLGWVVEICALSQTYTETVVVRVGEVNSIVDIERGEDKAASYLLNITLSTK